jgi:hypothetical protein
MTQKLWLRLTSQSASPSSSRFRPFSAGQAPERYDCQCHGACIASGGRRRSASDPGQRCDGGHDKHLGADRAGSARRWRDSARRRSRACGSAGRGDVEALARDAVAESRDVHRHRTPVECTASPASALVGRSVPVP